LLVNRMGVRIRLLAGMTMMAGLLSAAGCAAAPTSSTPPVTSSAAPGTGQVTGVNHRPVLDSIVSEYHQIERGKTGGFRCIAHDEDGDTLTYQWSVTRGSFSGQGALVSYTAPDSYVDAKIEVTVSDGRGGSARGSFTLPVVCCSYANKNSEWSG
jgi:hypothetical protein